MDRVDLKWDPPKDTGGAPITKYIIEKKERYGTWEPIHESEVRVVMNYTLNFLSVFMHLRSSCNMCRESFKDILLAPAGIN